MRYPQQLESRKNKGKTSLDDGRIQKSEVGLHQHFEYASMICSKNNNQCCSVASMMITDTDNDQLNFENSVAQVGFEPTTFGLLPC